MAVVVVTPAATEPVTTAEAKAHLVVEHADDDTLIDSYIAAARSFVEVWTGRQLVSVTYDLFLDTWSRVIEMPRPPLSSVTTVKYTDVNGVQQTWTGANYQTDTDTQPGRIMPVEGEVFPNLQAATFNVVEIRFVAGYGAAAAVPERFKLAIKQSVAQWYEYRKSVSELRLSDVKYTLRSLLDQDRMWKF